MKRCSKCGNEKWDSHYNRDRGAADGRRYVCKTCDHAYGVRWRVRNPDRHTQTSEYRRNSELKRRYGITVVQYDSILSLQKHSCAICLTPQQAEERAYPVDHDHVTGEVRGILCHGCNLGLGHFNDNPVVINNAKEYIAMPAEKRIHNHVLVSK